MTSEEAQAREPTPRRSARPWREPFSLSSAARARAALAAILLLAFALRVWQLTSIPPGLTHDEANHGREAIGILDGVLRYFFPLNYGSEPLYSYTVALSMAALGRGLFALRLVNVVFGLAAVAITAAWAAPRLGRPAALLGAALLAVSFWPLASSREALRAGMLPFFMGLAVWAFWRILEAAPGRANGGRAGAIRAVWPYVLAFGLALAATLHIYLAARVAWLLFPLFLGYLALAHRAGFRRAWPPALAGLLLGGLLSAPLFLYLRAHPEMQTRLDMLDGPLQAIAAGQWRPVLANVANALLAFVWPGRGDAFLAYNIPGRPVFDVVSAVLFIVGLGVCLWRWRRPTYAFLLLWFAAGILPSLITGPTANTTRNLAALPAVFLIPAIGFVALMGKTRIDQEAAHAKARREQRTPSREERRTQRRTSHPYGRPSSLRLSPFAPLREVFSLVTRHWSLVAALLWLGFAAVVSGRDYFGRWANMPAVRGAYQSTLAAALEHVAAAYPDAEPVVFASVYPGAAHDPSIAFVLAADRPALSRTARWADTRWALVLPPGAALAVAPASTSPHPALAAWLAALETVEMRPDDLDPRFTVYRLDGNRAAADLAAWAVAPVDFGGAVELVAAHWLAEGVRPGETAELLTAWRVLDPTRTGPGAPPTFATNAVLFTHVLDGAGGLLSQRDSLDAPSWAWQAGDLFVQIHPLAVPTSAAPGEYAAVVGLYDRATGVRLPASSGGDTAPVPSLLIEE